MVVALHVVGVLALLGAAALHPRLAHKHRRLVWAVGPLLIALSLLWTGDLFVIKKWIPRLAMPLGLVWMSLTGLACWYLARERRVGRWLAALSLVLWVTSCNAVAVLLLGALEAGYAPPADDTRFDALLVLGGGTSIAPHGGAQVSPSGDRIVTAARLYHRGIAERIVVGGEAIAALESDGQTRDLGEQTRRILLELGVPDEAIVVRPGAHNTREEAATFQKLVAERGWEHVGLLTSAWHLPRAMLHANRAGLRATPVPADFRGGPPAWNVVEILPSAAGAYSMRIGAWEVLGVTLKR